ncbi:hypothetical protein HK096_006467 [Nowakowskiella sp. JEL0078]|nr:hypothetical protein HK096_006467 [Nowakowskiella sp. JEL0078]
MNTEFSTDEIDKSFNPVDFLLAGADPKLLKTVTKRDAFPHLAKMSPLNIKSFNSDFDSERLADCYKEKQFADSSELQVDGSSANSQKKSTKQVVSEIVVNLTDPRESESSKEDTLAEAYPHQVGAAEHQTTISAIAEDVNMWNLLAPRTTTLQSTVVNKPRQKSPTLFIQACENVVSNLVEDAEDFAAVDDSVDHILKSIFAEESSDNKNTEIQKSDQIIRDLHLFVSSTGAVATEELIEALLREGRRVQNEQDQQPKKSVVSETPKRSFLETLFGRKPSTLIPKLEFKSTKINVEDNEIIKDIYGKISSSGGADTDGILELLLREARNLSAQKENSELKAKL